MSESAKLPKPRLRGLLHSQIRTNLIVATALTVAVVVVQKIFVNDVHKNKYADFYKNYDIEKEFNRMRNKGLFDSCEPDN